MTPASNVNTRTRRSAINIRISSAINTVTGKYFEGDGNPLPKENGAPFSRKIEQAREYWKWNVKSELPELLVIGKIEVAEIIHDFSA